MEIEYNCILIREGEIFLKGKNRNQFEKQLLNNIKFKLKNYEYLINTSRNRLYIESFKTSYINDIVDELKTVFGIHSISRCIKIKTDLENIFSLCSSIMPIKGTFRVSVKRADKSIKYTSIELAKEIGGKILLQNPANSVDLENFEYELIIDIRENGYTYIYFEKIPGGGGLPVGSSNKGLVLLSGGIDSPVAAIMMSKRGMKVEAIHFHSYPFTGELALKKVRDLCKIISKYNLGIKLHIVKFTEIQQEIYKRCPKEFLITIMRRFMMRIAEKISLLNNLNCIITGESLGQVASQTIEGITSTDMVLSSLPVLRPLIAYDKTDTIVLANKFNTFNLSILPYEDCCTVFLPDKPSIHPNIFEVEKAEIGLCIESLVQNAIETIEIEKY
jgi:thiamine biosynthesis protein ThiI